MQRNSKVVTAATLIPVSLSDFKDHLGFVGTYTDQDELLWLYLNSAISYAEGYMGYPLMEQSISFRFDSVGGNDSMDLYPNVTSITHVKYKENADSDWTTMSADDYELIDYGAIHRVLFSETQSYYAYEVTFVVGYDYPAKVPTAIKGAILLIASRMFAKREESVKRLPTTAEELLDMFSAKTFL